MEINVSFNNLYLFLHAENCAVLVIVHFENLLSSGGEQQLLFVVGHVCLAAATSLILEHRL